MSKKYGTNMNDLDLDMIDCLNEFCLDCAPELVRGEDPESLLCEGHCTVYYPDDQLDVAEFVKSGKSLKDVVDWYILHDTNTNFVSLVGDVPLEYLTADYVNDTASNV